jgi:protein-disulfide isomerase
LLHFLGVIVAALVIVAAPRKYIWPIAGLLAAAVFAVVQAYTRPEAVYDAGRADASLPVIADGEVPVLGAADAPEELTLLFDFQCVHCRRLHRVLPEVVSAGPYRIRLCPVPLSSACNPYIPNSGIDRFAGSCPLTRYALAVWYARPNACEAYWDFLLGSGDEHDAINPAAAEARARELLGADFDAALADPRIDNYLKKVEELFGRTSNAEKSGIPRLIHGQNWLVPETDQADKLLELIRLSL